MLGMYMLWCKVVLEEDLSIGAIFTRKNYLEVPYISITRPNCMKSKEWILELPHNGKLAN
jgi:hypothetical protein